MVVDQLLLNKGNVAMGEINLPRDERERIKGINQSLLSQCLEQCVREERAAALNTMRLYDCGEHISSKLRYFEQALVRYQTAKASKKRSDTLYDSQSAGRDLEHAVQVMKARVVQEEEQEKLFFVDDHIMQPYGFSEKLSVSIGYKWRKTIEDDWTYSRITFEYQVEKRLEDVFSQSKRTVSHAQQERSRREMLEDEWNGLMRHGLYSLRDYFRDGGSGSEIPLTFKVIPDTYSRRLNNHSTKFWIEKPQQPG